MKTKHITLFIAGALLSITMVHAQQGSDSTEVNPNPGYGANSNYQNYPTNEMKKIKNAEIPSSLRTTLEAKDYRGWENGSFYYNSKTQEYFYQPVNSSSQKNQTDQKQNTTWYRFDKSGKRVAEKPR